MELFASQLQDGLPSRRSGTPDACNSEEILKKKLIHTTVLRMALLRLAMKGVTAKKAAEILGCNPSTARTHYADPTFKRAVYEKVREAFGEIDEAFETASKTLHERIQEQALKSFQDLVALLERNDLGHAHRIKINQDFLNRCEESQPLAKHTTQLEPAALARASQVAREMEAAASGKLTYIEPHKREKTG